MNLFKSATIQIYITAMWGFMSPSMLHTKEVKNSIVREVQAIVRIISSMCQCVAGLYSPWGDEKGSGMNRLNDLGYCVQSAEQACFNEDLKPVPLTSIITSPLLI